MADTNSVEVILDFLRRNRFTRAEAALRSELSNCSDVNGFLQKLTLEEKDLRGGLQNDKGKPLVENHGKPVVENHGLDSRDSVEVSKELIVKEIECGTGRNAAEESKWRTVAPTGERNKSGEVLGTSEKNFTFSKGSEDSVLDLYSWKFNPSNGPVEPYQNDSGSRPSNALKAPVFQQSKYQTGEASDATNSSVKSGEANNIPAEKTTLWLGSSGKASTEPKYDLMRNKEPKELDAPLKCNASALKENLTDNHLSRTGENVNSSTDLWKDCSVKTVFPFSKGDVSTSYNGSTYSDRQEEKRRVENGDVMTLIKEQVDEVGRALYLGKLQGSSGGLSFPLPVENPKEEFPRLPPVKIKSEDKPLAFNWGDKFECDGLAVKLAGADNSLLIGSYLDVPIGQDIKTTG